MSKTIIPSTPTALPLPPLPKIYTNNKASALVAVAESDSTGGPTPITVTAGDVLLTPLQPIAAGVNVGMEWVSVVLSATATTQITPDVLSMTGASGGTFSVSAEMEGAVSSEALNTPFPAQQPVVNCQLLDHDESLYEKGYESEGAQM